MDENIFKIEREKMANLETTRGNKNDWIAEQKQSNVSRERLKLICICSREVDGMMTLAVLMSDPSLIKKKKVVIIRRIRRKSWDGTIVSTRSQSWSRLNLFLVIKSGIWCHLLSIRSSKCSKYHLVSLLNEKQRSTFANFWHLFYPCDPLNP